MSLTEHSNSLADLAHRIKAEHEAVGHALKRDLRTRHRRRQPAVRGQGAAQARAMASVQEHCQISERSASRYMRIARHAPELNVKPLICFSLFLSCHPISVILFGCGFGRGSIRDRTGCNRLLLRIAGRVGVEKRQRDFSGTTPTHLAIARDSAASVARARQFAIDAPRCLFC